MKKFLGSAATMVVAAAMLAGCPPVATVGGEHTQVLEDPTVLDGKQLYFIPADTVKRAGDEGYVRVVSDIVADNRFVEDNAGHTAIDFTVADPAVLQLGEPVYYYGKSDGNNRLFVGSNGTIGIGVAGGGNTSLEQHFAAPQISLLSFAAEDAVSATWDENDERVVITYETANDDSVQAVFVKTRGIDGDIELNFSNVAHTATSVVGLSNGQLTANVDFLVGFVGGDLTANFNTGALETAS